MQIITSLWLSALHSLPNAKVRLPWRPQACSSTIWWNTLTHLTLISFYLWPLCRLLSPFFCRATWTWSFPFIFAITVRSVFFTLDGCHSLTLLTSFFNLGSRPRISCVTQYQMFTWKHLLSPLAMVVWDLLVSGNQSSCDTQIGR